MKRAALVLVLGLLAFLTTAVPAHAHADLLFSTPEDGAVLAAAPDEVVLSFSEELLADTVVVSVSDETGMAVRVLSLEVAGTDVIVTWPPGMSGREYDVNYRVVSQDGHPVEGTVSLTVESDAPTAAASESGTPSTTSSVSAVPVATADATTGSTSEGSGLPAIAAISAGLGVGIAVGFVFWILRRRSGASGESP